MSLKRFFLFWSLMSGIAAWGQFTIDGNLNEAPYLTLAWSNGNNGFGTGNDVGAIRYFSNATTLYIGVSGGVSNFTYNNIILFIDDVSYSGRGGLTLGGSSPTGPGVFNTSCIKNTVMDNGFDVDYAFAINKGGTNTRLFLDAVRFGNILPTDAYFQQGNVGNCDLVGSPTTAVVPFCDTRGSCTPSQTIRYAYQDGYAAPPSSNSLLGLELEIPYAALPGVAAGHRVRFFVVMTNGSGEFSNECVPGDLGPTNPLICGINLGSFNAGETYYTMPGVVLPIRFVDVNANLDGGGVRLSWSVAEQGEASHYEVERSADGVRYDFVERVAVRSQGLAARYQWVDLAPLSGRSLYRIAARKRDGSVLYSKAVSIDNQGISLISIYPNPVADQLFVRLGSLSVRPGSWSIFNEVGQRVLSGSLTSSGPIECISIPPALPAGSYRFSLISEGKVVSRSFVKGR